MSLGRASLVSRLSLVGAVALTVLLGNMRGLGSSDSVEKSVGNRATKASVGVAPVSSEVEGLVPAVFAWDPAVRFVYDRHVSKWM